MTGLVDDLNKIHQSANHLLSLINRVLDYSKIEVGRMALHLEWFDVDVLVNEVINTARPLVARNSNHLEVEYPSDIGTMCGDRLKVQEVLLNLLSNAAKFTRSGTIELSISRMKEGHTDWICFRVADSGIGMTEEQISILFRAFAQADASIAREYGGTGLGLAISQSYCQLMGGHITVESAIGKGSTFTVTLPAVVQVRTGEEHLAIDSPSPSATD
jgi:signal transduction histidine kinase